MKIDIKTLSNAESVTEFSQHVIMPRLLEMLSTQTSGAVIGSAVVATIIGYCRDLAVSSGIPVRDENYLTLAVYLGLIAEREGWFLSDEE